MAQVKDPTKRVNVAEGKIARLNTGKAKLDEIISVGRRTGMKLGLGYTGTNLSHTLGMYVAQHESSHIIFGTEVLYVNAHPMHHFINEPSPIAVLPPLPVGSSINHSMEDIEEGSEGDNNAEEKRSLDQT
ncbi:hypothetical protein M9H77_30237 [Catharanthus roseus]|uniref:Uncharacterized protein n=1 Tax=Catharanthus roseus TaxID=4058 RepID=A0ACB9ZWN9_CATRO|nr:hypothetical protein M9H77_30237 [Catharanthus roseus]